MTFLDVVRAIGDATLAKCVGCSIAQHRREAAETLLVLAGKPELADALIESIRAIHRRPIFDDKGNFEGFEGRVCGDHRTVGLHRAWCHDCGEWCYPSSPCVRCEGAR